MRGWYKPKGDGPLKEKSIWTFLDLISKASFADSPWSKLLKRYGCDRDAPQLVSPCPCVWRRPVTGAVSREEQRENRWGWRDSLKERAVRLALQHREDAPVARW